MSAPSEHAPAPGPVSLRCGACGHVFTGPHLPLPMRTAIRTVRRLTCPMCSAGADRIFLTGPPDPAPVPA